MLIPFIIMLLVIALAPLLVPVFWESNRNKAFVTLAIAVPAAVVLVVT